MDIWSRLPAETDESFLFFQAYRDALPPRQLARVRTSVPGKVAPPLPQLLEWYTAFNWAARAKAWDEHLDVLRQLEREALVSQTAKEAAARDAELLHEARQLVSRELDKMLRTSMQSEAEFLKPAELNKLLENVIKLGRLSRGETTENVGTELDTSGLDVDDLRKLVELRRKMKGG